MIDLIVRYLYYYCYCYLKDHLIIHCKFLKIFHLYFVIIWVKPNEFFNKIKKFIKYNSPPARNRHYLLKSLDVSVTDAFCWARFKFIWRWKFSGFLLLLTSKCNATAASANSALFRKENTDRNNLEDKSKESKKKE